MPAISGLVGVVAVGAACGWVLYLGLFPDLYYLAWIVVMPSLALFVLAIWSLRAVALRRRAWRDRWAVAMVAAWAVTTATIAGAVPMRVGLLMVRPGLDQALASGATFQGAALPYHFGEGPIADYCGTPGIQLFPL